MRKRKFDPKAYARLQNRLAKNYRSKGKKRWGLVEIKAFELMRQEGQTHPEIAKKFGRSLASAQGVQRKLNHIRKLGLSISEWGTVSEKILYSMARGKK